MDQSRRHPGGGDTAQAKRGDGARQGELLLAGHSAWPGAPRAVWRSLTCADEEDVVVSISSCHPVCNNLGEGVLGPHL